MNQIADEEVTSSDSKLEIQNEKIINKIDKKANFNLINKSKNKTNYLESFIAKLNYNKMKLLNNNDLKLGTLIASPRVRRRSSELDREQLIKLESRGVSSFEDASDLDNLQYKIINLNDE